MKFFSKIYVSSKRLGFDHLLTLLSKDMLSRIEDIGKFSLRLRKELDDMRKRLTKYQKKMESHDPTPFDTTMLSTQKRLLTVCGKKFRYVGQYDK